MYVSFGSKITKNSCNYIKLSKMSANHVYRLSQEGELAEWLNAVVLKTTDGLRHPRVRISDSPPSFFSYI
tara:strand:+ start:437 stop:646 length:210 start_codon:yes stop_codon:yes gene_type:complete